MALRKKKSVRDYLWEYPLYIIRAVINTAPLSYIVIFLSILGYLFTFAVAVQFVSRFRSVRGNTFVEGTVGNVTTLNPIYNPQSQLDNDVRELLFERFIEIAPDGSPQANIAKGWEMSADELEYRFEIDNGWYWHDGVPVTARDVVFTIETAVTLSEKFSQDTVGLRFSDITIGEDKGDVTLRLLEANATIFESLALYVLPEHLLSEVPLQKFDSAFFNEFPIGSGPYKFVRSNDTGIVLEAFDMHPDPVQIANFEFRLFSSEEELEVAFRNNELDALSGAVDTEYVKEYGAKFKIMTADIERRKKLLFLNNREGVLENVSMRRGLSMLIDKDAALARAELLGSPTYSPFMESSWAYVTEDVDFLTYDSAAATNEFLDAGYLKDQKSGYYQSEDGKLLTLKLTYLGNEKNQRLAEALKTLYDMEGVVLNLDPQEYSKLTRETLANRDFDILLYEIELTADPDQYDLWHSLKVAYPNLNISGYEFSRVDILLEKGRRSTDQEERLENYSLLHRFLVSDAPVIFLYEPSYSYIVSERVSNVSLADIQLPSDRFKSVSDWILE